MFCARCGKEIDDDSTFCPFCGQNTEEPVESSGGGEPKESVKMPGKKIMGGIAVIAVVLLVVFGISKVIGGISNRAKSLPEKLFAMSAEEYISLTREEFKGMLEEEGTLYEELDLNVRTLTTDDFMGCDCIYGYGAYDDDWGATPAYTAGLSDCAYFVLAFETEEDFKDGQKSVKKYLEKEIVKKSGILKTDGAFWSGDTYLVECSDKGVDEIWKKLSEKNDRENFYSYWIYDNYTLAERTGIIDKDSQINEEALLKALEDMDYKMYKFVQVCYPQMDNDLRSYFPSDKSYTDYTCCIQVTCLPMTEEDYILFAGQWGYDAISGKEIDIDEFKESVDRNLVNAYFDENASDDSEVRRDLEKELYIRLYMMENHKFNMFSKAYIESEDEKKLWYIHNFDWDTDADASIDLSNYRNSSSIYCAVECNYNSDTSEYFESELDRALYLADKDYKADTGEYFESEVEKRFWFMKNYSYDIESGEEVDEQTADALIGYQVAYSEWLTTLDLKYHTYMTLADLNSDNIPELIVVDRKNYRKVVSNARAQRDTDAYDFDVFIASYKAGDLKEYSTHLEGSGSSEVHLRSVSADKFIISWSQFIPVFLANNDYAIMGDVRSLSNIINITETGFENGSTYEWFQSGYSGANYYAIDGNTTDAATYGKVNSGDQSEDYLSYDRVFEYFDSAVEYYEQ